MAKESQRQTRFNLTRLLTVATATALFVFLLAGSAMMQGSNKPYEKDRLIKVLRLNALPTAEIVQRVRERGVDFELTSAVEAEFRAVGARPELLEAMRGNYRAAPAARPAASASRPSSSAPAANIPAGPPLSKNEIVTLLQNGVSVERVEQVVDTRGVNFAITPEIAQEITAAGGNRSLIGTITVKATSTSSGAAARPGKDPFETDEADDDEPDYEEYTDQALSALQANDAYSAIRYAQQAVKLDATQSQAYALLGIAYLYGTQDLSSATQAMRAAIERGGAAAFRAYHDHDGFFQSYCQGTFFVGKSNVTFKADDGNHTFEANDSDISEAKLNGFVGSEYGAFHLKVAQGGSKPKNFNFAPATAQAAESNLILTMIKSYR